MDRKITFEQLFEASPHGILATDTQGRLVLMNGRARHILNINEHPPIHSPLDDLLPQTGKHVRKCIATGLPQVNNHLKEQQARFIANINPIRDRDRLAGVMISLLNLDQLEIAARHLESYRQFSRQLQSIIESSSDGIWVYDGKGHVMTINGAATLLHGIHEKDVIGKHYSTLLKEKLFDRSVMTDILKTKRQVTIWAAPKKTGKKLLVTGTPVFNDQGEISMVVVNIRDISELNAIRNQLEQARLVTAKYQAELAELKTMEHSRQHIVAESVGMEQVHRMALKLARMQASNILILGESGTGKGLLVDFIHQNSRRAQKPLIQINCAALPENLLEAELFGYEGGAFTGAREEGKAGLFELAHKGMLFLDEIGDMPVAIQAKLLKYLDDQTIMRLGSTQLKTIDCTIIAATNRNLKRRIEAKKFRRDLFYRLNTFTLQLPPLRERENDIFELVNSYLNKYNNEYGLNRRIASQAMSKLMTYDFPGNIRELKNIIKMAVVLNESDVLDESIINCLQPGEECFIPRGKTLAKHQGLKEQVASFEKKIIGQAMKTCATTRELAHRLQVSQPTIVRKLKRYSLSLKK